MIEWFKNLRIEWQLAIFMVVVSALGGIIGLLIKKGDSSKPNKSLQQKGSDNTAAIVEGSGNTIARGDIHTDIEGGEALNLLVRVSEKAIRRWPEI